MVLSFLYGVGVPSVYHKTNLLRKESIHVPNEGKEKM